MFVFPDFASKKILSLHALLDKPVLRALFIKKCTDELS